MGYRFRGLIGVRSAVAHAAELVGGVPADLPQGYAVLAGPVLHPDAPAPKGTWSDGRPFWRLVADWEDAAVAASAVAPVAYVEADHFGGVGVQTAVLWRDGQVAGGPWGRGTKGDPVTGSLPDATPIDTALRRLGVRRAADLDEFDTLELGGQRLPDPWEDDD